MRGGWERSDVARAQRDRVIEELTHHNDVGPFAAFLWAMHQIGASNQVLLDVGCGVGHYGVLCEREFPNVSYTGTDASAAIISEAKLLAPMGRFYQRDFTENAFDLYDIVMASQVVEVLPDPVAAMTVLLNRAAGWVILNRIRLTEPRTAPSHPIEETTYCGESGTNWLWNRDELYQLISQCGGRVIAEHTWDNQICLVILKKDVQCRESSTQQRLSISLPKLSLIGHPIPA